MSSIELLWVQLFLLGTSLFGALALAVRFRRQRGWREIAERCGLDVVSTSILPWIEGFTARSGPVEIQVTKERFGASVKARVHGALSDLAAVTVRHELLRLPGTQKLKVGAEALDNTFLVQGPEPFVTALFDARLRRTLIEINQLTTLSIDHGQLRAEISRRQLLSILPCFRDLGLQLAAVTDVPRRLAENVRQDPEAGVRLHNLLVLVRDYPGHPSTAEALRTASEDASPQVRLQAALALGPEGRGLLQSLAEELKNDEVSARAVAALGPTLPLELVQSILDSALFRWLYETARAGLEVLGSLGGAAIPKLAEVAAHKRAELAAAAARGLGATGDPAAEAPLLAALARDDRAIQEAAAEALGRVGTAAAVLPLQEAAEGSAALRRITRQSIAEIQTRLAGAVPGQLSLAMTEASDAGQLSLAPHEAGQLSLAPDPAGRLSLSPGEAPPLNGPSAKVGASLPRG